MAELTAEDKVIYQDAGAPTVTWADTTADLAHDKVLLRVERHRGKGTLFVNATDGVTDPEVVEGANTSLDISGTGGDYTITWKGSDSVTGEAGTFVYYLWDLGTEHSERLMHTGAWTILPASRNYT
jgi:hypothetical protein